MKNQETRHDFSPRPSYEAEDHRNRLVLNPAQSRNTRLFDGWGVKL
jgi:hypothetical protein